MQEEYLFSGTPAEFGTTAETFSDREDTKAGLVRFWVDRPHQANRSIWDARLGIKSPIHQDAVSLSGGFALDSPTIGGKNAGYRAMVVLRVQSTRVGTLIIVTGEDSAWATLSPYWNQFTEYLRKFGWQLIPLGEEEQAAGIELQINCNDEYELRLDDFVFALMELDSSIIPAKVDPIAVEPHTFRPPSAVDLVNDQILQAKVQQGLRKMAEQEEQAAGGGETRQLSLLSDTEQRVFRLAIDGSNRQDIADDLNISTSTVDAHIQHISEKLELGVTKSISKLRKMAKGL